MSSNMMPGTYGDDDTDGDPHEGYVTEERAEEMFVGGLRAMREMLARFVEQSPGDPNPHPTVIAQSMRANWNPSWGDDPGKPDEIAKNAWDLED